MAAEYKTCSGVSSRLRTMLIQIALDTMSLEHATALAAGLGDAVDVIEAGTPLIKRYGMTAVRVLRQAAPTKLIVADLKTFDSARAEVGMAADAGADMVTVLGCAGDATISTFVRAAHARGLRAVADVVGVLDVAARAAQLERFGADYLGVHAEEDVSPRPLPLGRIAQVAAASSIPLVVAGGVTLENVSQLRPYAPAILVVGSAATKSADPAAALRELRARHTG